VSSCKLTAGLTEAIGQKKLALRRKRTRRPSGGAVHGPRQVLQERRNQPLRVSRRYAPDHHEPPITFFIGGSDDWTAPGPCVDLAVNLSAVGKTATITVYSDTYQGFDGSSTQPRRRLEVPNGVNPGKGVTVATNPAERDDAYAKLKKYLREHLRS